MPRFDVDGVLFDMDGVLVDSMEQHARSYDEVLGAAYGIDVDPEEVYRREGRTGAEVADAILADHGIEVTDAEAAKLGEAKQEAFRQMGMPEVADGAEDAIVGCKERAKKVGIVTGTDRKNVRFLLGELSRIVDAIVSSDDVENGKPDPEPYLLGAEELGLDPKRVLVVENAPNGVASARAAGCQVVGFTSTLTAEELGVDVATDDLREVVSWI